MLDVITDFWKPVKKQSPQEALDLDRLQAGCQITFGTVPQTLLSGQKFKISSVNTYQFGDEGMTSFVLANDAGEAGVSLIVANADGEQYLAISRRVAFADRMRMFDPVELEAVAEQADAAKLSCREIDANWRHWLVSGYKKEISGLHGAVIKGDYRNGPVPANANTQPFDYLLLTSDNNEYAIEIERYADGRLEVYATIYRRITDIVEMEQPGAIRPAAPVLEVVNAEPVAAEPAEPQAPEIIEVPKAETAAAPQKTVSEPEAPAAAPVFTSFLPPQPTQENKPMQSGSSNGAATIRQETKNMNNRIEAENDAIECDLRAANKIIEEAIRNEMRLSDVVRRIIALPVSNPDSVQIPITLTDADFQLLAIRYGLPASDRSTIKNRIIEEINDFSGNGKKN